jgi:hypothetical protein
MSREIEEAQRPANLGRRRALKQLVIGLGASAIVQPNGGILGGQETPKKDDSAKTKDGKNKKKKKGGGK